MPSWPNHPRVLDLQIIMLYIHILDLIFNPFLIFWWIMVTAWKNQIPKIRSQTTTKSPHIFIVIDCNKGASQAIYFFLSLPMTSVLRDLWRTPKYYFPYLCIWLQLSPATNTRFRFAFPGEATTLRSLNYVICNPRLPVRHIHLLPPEGQPPCCRW